MDISTILTSVLSTLGITSVGAWWLGRTWITHQLDRQLEQAKTNWEGDVKKRVEEYLGDRAAARDYEYEARKRLYQAIGPLRFQLIIACRDVANHIKIHGMRGYTYPLEPTNYYGQSTLFRIVRPLALMELIERQIAYADFAVDPQAVELLRFKRSAYSAFSGGDVIASHPDANWDEETEHVFYHSLNRIANTVLVVDGEKSQRPLMFHEFEEFLGTSKNLSRLEPLPGIFREFSVEKTPIFWVRLVCYGFLCAELVNRQGANIGFENLSYNVSDLLSKTDDDFITTNKDLICDAFNAMQLRGL